MCEMRKGGKGMMERGRNGPTDGRMDGRMGERCFELNCIELLGKNEESSGTKWIYEWASDTLRFTLLRFASSRELACLPKHNTIHIVLKYEMSSIYTRTHTL
uniref:Uncharacterized protein n=1 Tax=Caenorhabditis japonica TaxID=281687 RepID=A0A8R1EG74_CAEJA